ncbi:MAG TPA: DUF1565 domain-containing protein, partial [Myxococcaceae bacterium]|nr:DUF1565 domain-containing protein [Myxococcaceae bacterium]
MLRDRRFWKEWGTRALTLAGVGLLMWRCAAEPEGRASIAVSVQQLAAGDVRRVQVTVSGPSISPDIVFDLTPSGTHWSGIIGAIPVGPNRTFLAQAFDSNGAVVYEGSASGIAIQKNKTTAVILLLQQKQPPDPFLNTAPFIDSVTASANGVDVSELVSLIAVAHDVDVGPPPDAVSYAWTATAGSFSAPASATPTWTAPAVEGPVTLTLTVSDGRGASNALSFTITVAASRATGSADVIVDVNTWPTVAQVTASPTRLAPGENTSLNVTAADADGDKLSYAWSDGGGPCAGTFSDVKARNPTWKAPAAAPASGRCTLSASVTDGRGGSNTGSIGVWIGSLASVNFAPYFDGTYQSALEVGPGETITFRGRALDPEGQTVTYAWVAAAGALGPPTPVAGGSEVVWTAPAICSNVTITLNASDPSGVSTPWVFSAHVKMPLSDVDLPDPAYADMNCDGIDGDVAHAYFVSTSGADANPGTQAAPFRTIQHAVDAAAANPARWQVLVARGTYAETVRLANGVSLWGQYDPVTWARSQANETLIQSPTSTGLLVSSYTVDGYVEGMRIRAAAASGSGQSSQAVLLSSVSGALRVRYNKLEGGNGADGSNGGSGSPGASGSWASGGSGGSGGGGGGHGGNEASPGGGGACGSSSGGGGGPGNSGLGGGSCGSGGGSGGGGSSGGIPSGQAQGQLGGTNWQALAGSSGQSDSCGGGGGGGGWGLCICGNTFGGGGGGDGGGGSGGGPGTGAGGSFGVVAIHSPSVVLTDNTISSAFGGSGGA